MDEVQRIDDSNTAPSSNIRDELSSFHLLSNWFVSVSNAVSNFEGRTEIAAVWKHCSS
jgi:hypothetical protein